MKPKITSSILPQPAVDYLNSINADGSKEVEREINVKKSKDDMLAWGLSFVGKSSDYIKASYETDWHTWRRNADGTFDPALKAKKESWQSAVFVPLTPSHTQTIQSHLYKTLVGIQPSFQFKSRNISTNFIDQSDNVRDLILCEMDKSRYNISMNSVLDDATTYGSGFARMYYDRVVEKRKVRVQNLKGFDIMNPLETAKILAGKIKSFFFKEELKDVEIYAGVRFKHISIWDILPDPKALEVRGNSIGLKFWITYGEIQKGVKEGYYLKEAADILKGVKGEERFDEGKDGVASDRGIADMNVAQVDYNAKYQAYEIFARLPQKWVLYKTPKLITDPEELMPARLIFVKEALLAIEQSDDYAGEPPIYKLDYFPVVGRFFSKGIPELLKDCQSVATEVVNQRLDNGALILNRGFAVVEKALVDPGKDLVSKPGMIIRLDAKYCPNGDIRNAITEFQMNDTPVRAGFAEVNDVERWAQEITSANRVTLGTQGQVNDANQTLGGQQIQLSQAGQKFAYIGLMMEFSFIYEVLRAYWKLIYANIRPEDVERVLGPERMANFQLMSPEEIEKDYVYQPLGVYTMENAAIEQAKMQAVLTTFGQSPFVNAEAFFDEIMRGNKKNPDSFKIKVPNMQIPPNMGIPPEALAGGEAPPVEPNFDVTMQQEQLRANP